MDYEYEEYEMPNVNVEAQPTLSDQLIALSAAMDASCHPDMRKRLSKAADLLLKLMEYDIDFLFRTREAAIHEFPKSVN